MAALDLDTLYATLDSMVVVLSEDPKAQGPAGLQATISQIRTHLNNISIILQTSAREKYQAARRLSLLKLAYDAEFDRILSEDVVVRQLPSMADKRARINTANAPALAEINAQATLLSDLEYVEKTIRFRHEELQSTMSALRLQRSLLEADINTGAYNGSEGSSGSSSTQPSPDTDDEDLSSMFDEAQAIWEARDLRDAFLLEGGILDPDAPPTSEEEVEPDGPSTIGRAEEVVAAAKRAMGTPAPFGREVLESELQSFTGETPQPSPPSILEEAEWLTGLL